MRTRQHGTLSCYKGGCRRPECRAAEREYDREYRRRRAYGRPTTDLIDAEPARAHARRLLGLGWGRRQIAAITGGDLSALLYGRRSEGLEPLRRIGEMTSRRILAIPLVLVPTGKRIDAAGSRRRAQALCLLGYPGTWQAERMGLNRGVVSRLINGTSEWVIARHAVAIRDLHAELWDEPAPLSRETNRVRSLATAKGYLPTLAFDDDLIDLPDADLEVELARRAADMDSAELYRCYRARLEGDRSPLIVAGAERYLAVRRESRQSRAA